MSTDALPGPSSNESFWYRLSYTPLRDALRGRWTASLDFRRAVAAAPLTPKLRDLICRVVDLTHLRAGEKVVVARDLISEFVDLVNSGNSVDQCAAVFGDPLIAAKCIRQEKKYERSLVCRIRRRLTDVDFRRAVSQSRLPKSIDALVCTVVGKTKLWPGEKLAVGRELIAHFREGLKFEATEEQLVTAFGDPVLAAKLIRIAKKRSRPLVYRTCQRIVQSAFVIVAGLLIVYAGLAIRFYSGSPKITRDFTAELNAMTATVPERDRAWPLYLEALRTSPSRPKGFPRVPPTLPLGQQQAGEFAAICTANAKSLDFFRRGAEKPKLGAPFDLNLTEKEIVESYYATLLGCSRPLSDPPRLTDMVLSRILVLCAGSDLLLFDAYAGLAGKDADRLVSDIRSLLGITRHTLQLGDVSATLGGLHNTLVRTEDLLDRVLWGARELLSTDDLMSISDQLVALNGGRFFVDLSVERLEFEDLLQRAYTDDGGGDGRLTGPDSYAFCERYLGRTILLGAENTRWRDRLVAPVLAAAVRGRRDTLAKYDAVVRMTDEMQRLPLWRRSGDNDMPISSSTQFFHFGLVDYRQAAYSRVAFRCEAVAQRRDATRVAIALEIFRRQTGSYPGSLEQLVPRLISQIPPDRYDGKSLKYRFAGGRPILYSIGCDRIDDGGRLPEGADRRDANWWASEWMAPRDLPEARKCVQRRGDWVLWPLVDE